MRSFLTPLLIAALTLTAPAATAQQGATEQTQAPRTSQLNPAAQNCTPDPRYAKTDFRAMWIASVVNLDWPARKGQSIQAQQQQLIDYFDLAKRNNFNAVVLQVRPAADTFWPSDKEPWSRWLTGMQGQNPGYDPLVSTIAEY